LQGIPPSERLITMAGDTSSNIDKSRSCQPGVRQSGYPAAGGNMDRSSITGQRLVAVFLLGCVLLNYPILFLFNKAEGLFGIPPLYLYIFGAWAFLIALMALIVERLGD
jgi:hypothetical protein